MPTDTPLSPARRAKLLQAYLLRCQGLSLRQIAEQMGCAHSTVSQYLKAFEQHREHIIEALAADQLLYALQQFGQADDNLHERHIQAARELRLLLDSLDRITDRRQRRERRIHENHAADSLRELKALEMLLAEYKADDFYPNDEQLAKIQERFAGPTPSPSPPLAGGDAEGRGGVSPTPVDIPHLTPGENVNHFSAPPASQEETSPTPSPSPPASRGEMSRSDREGSEHQPDTTEPNPSTPEPDPPAIEPNRTESNTTEHQPEQSPDDNGKSDPQPKKSRVYPPGRGPKPPVYTQTLVGYRIKPYSSDDPFIRKLAGLDEPRPNRSLYFR